MRTHPFAAVVVSGVLACGSALALSGCGSSTGAGAPASSSSATSSATGPGKLTITPPEGKPTTSFTFTFTAPETAGRSGQTNLGYELGLRGPEQTGCLAARISPVHGATAGKEVSVTLDPMTLGGRWCEGTYTARLSQLQSPVCTPGEMCPQFIRVAIIATGRFRVSSP